MSEGVLGQDTDGDSGIQREPGGFGQTLIGPAAVWVGEEVDRELVEWHCVTSHAVPTRGEEQTHGRGVERNGGEKKASHDRTAISALNGKTVNLVRLGHCLAKSPFGRSAYDGPMLRVIFGGWVLLLAEMGCGGTMRHSPGEGGAGGGPTVVSAGGMAACPCASSTLMWWQDGVFAPGAPRESISDCNQYAVQRMGKPTTFCSSTLADCAQARVGVDDLNAALLHPDVQNALAHAPVLVGRDLRPLDGTLLHLEVDGKVIEVGDNCPNDPSCRVPPGLLVLRELLGDLDRQEAARVNCDLK